MLKFFRKKMKSIMITVAVLFAASMFYGLGYQGVKDIKQKADKNSLATVNGEEIDHARYIRTVNNVFAQRKDRVGPQEMLVVQTAALNDVIDFTIMLQEARKKVRASGDELDSVIKQIIESNKLANEDQLKAYIKQTGIEYGKFKDTVKDEIIVSKMMTMIKSQVAIGPNDLREIRVRHILVQPHYVYIDDAGKRKAENEKAELEARLKAEDLLKKVKSGQNFAAVAKAYSDDKDTKEKGGDLGYFGTGRMIPEFESVAFSLKPGEIGDVVKSRFGFHIIKVEDTRLRSLPKEAKGRDISEYILQEKQDGAFRMWFLELKQKAKVEINNKLLLAYSYALAGNMEKAVFTLQTEVADDMYDPYKHFFLGDLYSKSGKIELGLFEYKKASDLGGNSPDFLIALGNAYLEAKKSKIKPATGEDFTKLAVDQFRRASLLAGDNKDLHTELKAIFNKLGYTSDAANETKELKRIDRKEVFEQEIKGRATMEQSF